MQVTLVTPDNCYFDGTAERATLVAWDGEVGILPGHAPLINRLGHGVARIFDGTTEHRFAVYGGFLKVQDDQVTVLAGGAATTQDGDAAQAKQDLDAAEAALAETIGAGTTGSELADLEEQTRRARVLHQLLAG